jgi:hypothetical protein
MHELTRRERRIADMAAEEAHTGIAETLFIIVKMIEMRAARAPEEA